MKTEMKTPKEKWLDEYSKKPQVLRKYGEQFETFLQWIGKTDTELVKEYKQATDKDTWRKERGRELVRWYNKLLGPNPTANRQEPYLNNSARAFITAVRSFYSSQCIEVKIRKGAIAKPQMATREHEFLLSELQMMYRMANLKEKATVQKVEQTV